MQAYFIAILITFILVVAWVLIEKMGEAYSQRHPECPRPPRRCPRTDPVPRHDKITPGATETNTH